MDLHQINLNYIPDEDRLLCRTSFRDANGGLQEIRAWLTRRIVRSLWGGMLRALETQVSLDKPQATHARTEIVGMEHASSVAQGKQDGNFANPYSADVKALPLGETPILVTKLTFNLKAGHPMRINLAPAEGQGFEFALAPAALHGFCSVLVNTLAKADWNLDLTMPGLQTPGAPPPVLN